MSVFVDGSRVTPGTEKCQCDLPGRPQCEFPCWQRLGLTTSGCHECGCPDLNEED